MKQGGVGYVAPDRGSFPEMAKMNRFVAEAGAIPTVAWLDGASEGERRMEDFVDVAIASGAAALNVIPDRNYTPGSPDEQAQEPLRSRRSRRAARVPGRRRHRDERARAEVRRFVRFRRAEAAGADVPAQRLHRLRAFGSAARAAGWAISARGRRRTSPRSRRRTISLSRRGAPCGPAPKTKLSALDAGRLAETTVGKTGLRGSP